MKRTGVTEFGEHLATYLYGNETVTVEQDGKAIGYYVPVRRRSRDDAEAVQHLRDAVNQVLEETGLTENELVELFDPRNPFEETYERLLGSRESR